MSNVQILYRQNLFQLNFGSSDTPGLGSSKHREVPFVFKPFGKVKVSISSSSFPRAIHLCATLFSPSSAIFFSFSSPCSSILPLPSCPSVLRYISQYIYSALDSFAFWRDGAIQILWAGRVTSNWVHAKEEPPGQNSTLQPTSCVTPFPHPSGCSSSGTSLELFHTLSCQATLLGVKGGSLPKIKINITMNS